jgi:hypothetical protein
VFGSKRGKRTVPTNPNWLISVGAIECVRVQVEAAREVEENKKSNLDDEGRRTRNEGRLYPHLPHTMSQWDGLRNEYLQLKEALTLKLDDEIPSLRGGAFFLISLARNNR